MRRAGSPSLGFLYLATVFTALYGFGSVLFFSVLRRRDASRFELNEVDKLQFLKFNAANDHGDYDVADETVGTLHLQKYDSINHRRKILAPDFLEGSVSFNNLCISFLLMYPPYVCAP